MYGESIGAIAFAFVNLKGHCQGHSDFEGLYLVKERSDNALLLDTSRK